MKWFSTTHTPTLRRPAVAGRFYEVNPSALARTVDNFLEGEAGTNHAPPKALIAPHAGYLYSGAIAGSTFRTLCQTGQPIRTVVLVGPAHYASFEGLALSQAVFWETPLGKVPVDVTGIERARSVPAVRFLEEAHAPEHCLEVELPFLQRALGSFSLVPLLVGEAEAEEVANVLEQLWGGPETVVVISSDLSHYLDYSTAQRLDTATADAITALEPDQIHPNQACGRLPIQGLLHLARKKNLVAKKLDLRNSGDTAGSRDRVVGYGAFGFYPS